MSIKAENTPAMRLAPGRSRAGRRRRGIGEPSFISVDMTVIGDLRSTGTLQIDGEVGGDVICRAVTVGVNGYIEGSIYAEHVRIAGTVQGRIEAIEIDIAKTAQVGGTVTHHKLTIERGATLDGPRPWRPLNYLEARRKW